MKSWVFLNICLAWRKTKLDADALSNYQDIKFPLDNYNACLHSGILFWEKNLIVLCNYLWI